MKSTKNAAGLGLLGALAAAVFGLAVDSGLMYAQSAGSDRDKPAATRWAAEASSERLQPMDIFELEWASDPQISPDGERVVYVRNSFDVMTDRRISNLWIIDADGSNNRALTSLPGAEASPRWSPDGSRILYLSNGEGEDGARRLWLRWVGTDDRALLATLTHAPGGLVWSPDGRWIAFSMFVPAPVEPFVELPAKPEGADWGEPFSAIDELEYRSDGEGYLEGRWRHASPADDGALQP